MTNSLLVRMAAISLLAFLGVGFLSASVFADQSFHTVRLPLVLTAGGQGAGFPQLTSGQVVDIHANGPTVYAIERYMINGAPPDTSLQVADVAWIGGCPSSYPPLSSANIVLPTVLLTTDSNGFAQGGITITPSLITEFGLHGVTLGIIWTLTSDSRIVVYSTPSCINVALD
jgi:hypothetical protein